MRTFLALFMSAMLLTSVSAQAETTKLTIDGSKGKLAAVIQKPQTVQGQQIPMVILMHGFGGSKDGRGGQKGMLEIIADKLEAQGIASIRFDFNGHGESEGEFWQHTVPNEIEDALKVYEYVRDLRYVSTVSVLGHSQGGVVASMVAGKLGAEIKAANVYSRYKDWCRDNGYKYEGSQNFYSRLGMEYTIVKRRPWKADTTGNTNAAILVNDVAWVVGEEPEADLVPVGDDD